MESKNTNGAEEIIKHDDINLDVSGGWSIFSRKLRCDNCSRVIDNEKTIGLTTVEGTHICEHCLGNYKKLMSQAVYDDYVRKLLGISISKKSFKIEPNSNEKEELKN